ncbi:MULTISPECIES: YihY/virulence factor BrkB family protein [unclassified Exiguobacterium]|uniref:YihY/virulence factor BrkB family protein n=1 Tax=unclassified Exiguobacterium TaxID=2644629 RepID=UPI001038774C|nr:MULTISPECIES: YihY/virulence factor BrkB family protein [unclassified Exiguobacterium]TCI44595.1 YihY/virulence factor BrkB family protein [Exiguobacterium sp. SH5S32]TCI51001.1 YihY/virulence factor BrkB family protein [Exiguobacterium sp. SH1S4]TCI59743.1 YihY/virulence factor BrkB family protein [Exiguobacterium sp. SH0S2]TCI69976.1 YihY/virulence factor BrkB family protein [Exiguobacterium sp. SH1S1]TCI76455.1 YihY/virulence factor BrkB family protein [Exiguobacterium sp. SH0S1]
MDTTEVKEKKNWLSFGKELFRRFKEHDVQDYGATLAFFWFLSIFPGIIFILALLSFFDITQASFQEQLNNLAPGSAATEFLSGIFEAIGEPRGGLLSIGAILAIWSASKGVERLINMAIHAYGEDNERNFFVSKGIALGLTFLLGVGVLLLIISNVFGSQIIGFISDYLPISGAEVVLINVFRYVLTTVILILTLSIFYKIAPQQHVFWKSTVPGAIFGVIAWQLVSLGFSLYVSNFGNYDSTYGSLGGIIVTLLWLQLTGMIILIGSEINATWQRFFKTPSEQEYEKNYKKNKKSKSKDSDEDDYKDIPVNTYG